MTSGKRDDLVTSEGVDEGSAASTVEDESSGAPGDGGAAPQGGPATEQDPAAPLDVETGDVRAARGAAPGQELNEGEG